MTAPHLVEATPSAELAPPASTPNALAKLPHGSRLLIHALRSAITGHRIGVQERTRYLEGSHKDDARRDADTISAQRQAEQRLYRAIVDVARPELADVIRAELRDEP
jgi:hypothetical protein